jgi:hypothetical protein
VGAGGDWLRQGLLPVWRRRVGMAARRRARRRGAHRGGVVPGLSAARRRRACWIGGRLTTGRPRR